MANFGVEGYRLPHTTTTLSWCDGKVGRGFITIRGDHLGEQKREELNKDCSFSASPCRGLQELEEWIYIGALTHRSHFWTSATMCECLEDFLTEDGDAKIYEAEIC